MLKNSIIQILTLFRQAPDCTHRKRPKRDSKSSDSNFDDGHPATIEVYSGLYVNENAEIVEGTDDSVFAEKVKEFISTFVLAPQNELN